MESVYHFVTIRVNETSWVHVWRLRSLFLGMGCDRSLPYALWLQLLMNSMRACLTMRLPCWQGSSGSCTSSTRRGGDHLGASSNAVTPPTLSPTAPRGRSFTPQISMTTTTGTATTRTTRRRSTASGTRRKRSSRRYVPSVCCPERLQLLQC
jgi:hypothetical protein